MEGPVAISDPKSTLSWFKTRALGMHRDMRQVPCANLAEQIKLYSQKHGMSDGVMANPESNALWFYGMNHFASLVSMSRDPLEPLEDWEASVMTEYHSQMVPRAVRAFYYLLLICIREARHNKSLSKDKTAMKAKFGVTCTDFFFSINGGETGIHQKFIDHPPACDLGTFVECVRWQFYNSSWNGGYGGKAWGVVSDCLVRFVSGEFSAEMMLDTIWTLSHNNGPIFNKGIYYGMYSSNLVRILDLQRAGMIPEAVLYDKQIASHVDPELIQAMTQLKSRFQIRDYIDWYVVEALGSVKKYPNEKKQQVLEYGPSPEASAAEKAAAEKAAAQALAEKKAAEEFAKNHIEIMPGLHVKKIEIQRSAPLAA